ncbi:UDP-N-acetylgalactosamine-undecaprenyl-phosphate N-acetylgalactosaminephosphotransferase [Stratiformator vulcanicus]|uniref:UDP-N-acetylgalactosamine-undecaprenyl-phosphate N-acetylgalactosaminephosphotransferase n=2 Tax=Stratiformator vulcanicus TaxID=2527980 RepID=A0A517R421_9PLAN|nr:sugar transferase [Stratiformator vulcanicus]QDT38639.1 UDP-N-acetylgalactosamine-undecaprenyl-phosphate N-acetylgalactosaminephosphotransferase [Stratiformator vulcanicus]
MVASFFGRQTNSPKAEDVLPAADRFDRIVQVELMRADRSESQFCLAVFDTVACREQVPPADFRFAEYILNRLRATDHAGCLGGGRIGVVLWNTDEDGARKFVNQVLEDCPIRPLPAVELFTHPSGEPVDLDRVRNKRGTKDSDDSDSDGAMPVRPLEELLLNPMPRWKRTLDVVGAAVGIVALSPLLFATALLIKLTSPGPIFFLQKRDGWGGKPFSILKFRTMYRDAEQRKAALRAQSEQDGPAFKMANDPRITPIGRFLRKSCIDELPQLWNVLKGDMTLVGPRPLDSREAAECEVWQRRRRWITPGLTCIWQVHGKSKVPFKEWMRMDIRYIRARSLWNDAALIIRTAFAVILHRGSH